MVRLILTFEQPGRKPLSIVAVHDKELVRRAAFVALDEAERQAKAADDSMLGQIRTAEVERLRTTLELLMPGIILDTNPARM